jgi:serine/threonine protein kinase
LIKIKEYHCENLLDDYNDIVKRCHLIEKVSNSVSFIPNTQITINGESLKYKQDLIKRKNYKDLNNQQKIGLLEQFAKDLDSLIPYGFVHGDINSSNVLYDGNRLNLIDLEPSFKQIKYGKKVVMSAVPLRSLNDLKNKTITIETDKIGFYLTCNRLMNIPHNLGNQRALMKKRRDGFEFLPIKESEFMKLSFVQIFDDFKSSLE